MSYYDYAILQKLELGPFQNNCEIDNRQVSGGILSWLRIGKLKQNRQANLMHPLPQLRRHEGPHQFSAAQLYKPHGVVQSGSCS